MQRLIFLPLILFKTKAEVYNDASKFATLEVKGATICPFTALNMQWYTPPKTRSYPQLLSEDRRAAIYT